MVDNEVWDANFLRGMAEKIAKDLEGGKYVLVRVKPSGIRARAGNDQVNPRMLVELELVGELLKQPEDAEALARSVLFCLLLVPKEHVDETKAVPPAEDKEEST